MTIKIERARKLANIGRNPRTWLVIIDAIPREIIAALTSRQVALVADAMHRQHEIGVADGWIEAGR